MAVALSTQQAQKLASAFTALGKFASYKDDVPSSICPSCVNFNYKGTAAAQRAIVRAFNKLVAGGFVKDMNVLNAINAFCVTAGTRDAATRKDVDAISKTLDLVISYLKREYAPGTAPEA